jgi:two-component sensor histidine kinase
MDEAQYRRGSARTGLLRAVLTLLTLAESPRKGIVAGTVLYAFAITSCFLGLERFALLTFVPVIGLSALLGGVAVGASFALLSGITAWFLFIPPVWSFRLATAADGFALLGFGMIAAAEVLLMDQLSGALRTAASARRCAAQRAMLLEFQHRIANGIQSAASLLVPERMRLGSGVADAAEMLEAAASRLQAMARLHRRLYDPDTTQHDFGALLEEDAAT